MPEGLAAPVVMQREAAELRCCSADPLGQLVGAAGFDAGPLGDGASVRTPDLGVLGVTPGLGPAVGGVLPRLLASVDGHVQQPVGGSHDFDAAPAGVVRLEYPFAVADVADQVVALPVTTLQELRRRLLDRIPWHVQAQEVPVADALLVRALTERGVCGVAGMDIGQLADLAVEERAALALLRGGLAGPPGVEVRDELLAAFEDVENRDRSVRTDDLDGGVDPPHRQPPTLYLPRMRSGQLRRRARIRGGHHRSSHAGGCS